jgi:hypothetical protein
MLERGLVTPARLVELFMQIEGQLYRYPALSPRSFREALDNRRQGAGEYPPS